MRRAAEDFVASGVTDDQRPYLGPVATDAAGIVQWIRPAALLPPAVQAALFRQTRVGKDGTEFTIYKFRTMVTAAEELKVGLASANEHDGVLFKVRADPRVTPLGGWLRRYSLDELPQLVNVVRGDMSLVGPRPALPDEVARYDVDSARRLVVKPGLTGLWQVSGRSDTTFEEYKRLDLYYVDNWSLAHDARIVCKTFAAVLAQRGAR